VIDSAICFARGKVELVSQNTKRDELTNVSFERRLSDTSRAIRCGTMRTAGLGTPVMRPDTLCE
jgi:hypothetical protein